MVKSPAPCVTFLILFISSKVIDRYGIFNPDGKGWPHPATYVIDKQGVVRWKYIEADYRKRPGNKQILQALKKIP